MLRNMGERLDQKSEIKKTQGLNPPVALGSLNHIISKAVKDGASDIHIEPREQFVWVRYRIGNSLQLATKLSLNNLEALVSAGKKMTGLRVSEHQQPQEAELDMTINGQDHRIHLSIIPVLGGEKMVIHLSPRSSKFISLQNLGFWGNNLSLIQRVLGQLRGVITVASSDRNSGSLTLVGMVNLLNHPTIKLAAVGDSTIDHLHSASRIKIDPSKGLTPDRSLRLILRQDPDVILVSNLEGNDTLKMILETAHKKLVCVSLLAQDISSLLQRLSSMALEPSLLASTMRVAVSQTVVRQLCSHCRESYTPTAAVKQQLEPLLEIFSAQQLHDLEKQALQSGLGSEITQLSSSPIEILRLWRPRQGGCEHCEHSGFQRYITLNEVVDTSDPKIQNLFIKSELRRTQIQAATLKANMLPKHVDGFIKCLRGLVSINDVFEVARMGGYV